MAKRSIALVLSLCAAAAAARGGADTAREPAVAPARGTTNVVVPRLVGLDVANAVAEVRYLGMIDTLVDDDRRVARGAGAGCTVIGQSPRPRTEVAVDGDLTTTVTITARCRRPGARVAAPVRDRHPRANHLGRGTRTR